MIVISSKLFRRSFLVFSIIVIFHLKNASDCHISEEPTNLLINFNIPSEIRTWEWTNHYEKLDALTIYAKEGNAGVKKVIKSLSKIDPENHGVIAL